MTNVDIIEGFPKEKSGTYVGWDEYEVSQNKLWTDGIGPCLAIAIYDAGKKFGTLAHISGIRDWRLVPESLYPENVVNTLVSKFENYKSLEAVLAGESLSEKKMSDIVRQDLAHLNIPIIGEDLGYFNSYRGREVHFNPSTGKVQVYRYPPLF